MEFIRRQLSRITRVKTIPEDLHETSLRRCLNTFDITLLGIGHMIGAGIYVLTGTVVREKAGPSAVLSFLFAGSAALLSALCYAEFGARIPKAGSAYSYTYVTIGEIWGFLIGWNIILEHMIGAASVARAWSGALDAVFNQAIRNGTIEHIGRLSNENEWVSEYPDLVAMGITFVAFLIIGFGAKLSVNFNSVFTILNAFVLIFIIVIGFTFADTSLWSTASGHGGFFPFGFAGTLSGAATCFFAYIGFEGIAIASEEAKDPEKSIPRATVMSLLTVTTLYLLVTAALTLMIPYYETNTSAAFPFAFDEVGAHWAKYIVALGTLLGISTSLLGSAFSLPRSVYAMAEDGLLFGFFGFVHPKTQTPIYAVIVFGAISALMALLFEITTLVEFMSIGTLFGYTIVAASIIILRYQPVTKCQFKLKEEEQQAGTSDAVADTSVVNVSETTPLSKSDPSTPVKSDKSGLLPKSKSHDDFGRLRQNLREVPILRRFEPGDGVKSAVVLMGLFMVGLMLIVINGADYLRIPFVPFIPSLSMLINIALMLSLTYLTWLRLVIWITFGLLLYFVYGIHYSRENKKVQGYGPMVEYKGDAAIPESAISGMTEEVKEQQPARKDEGLYQQ
ncbi:Cationic amino acid transporter 4 [Bulinus truncatus]|nr:Cationic amino acid transporter 4 [Bulinus truncatus]